MSFFNLFEPYIEAPATRTITQPVSGGIDISSFERLAQGVSVRNRIKRQTSLLPQINSGRTDFVVECLNFGTREPVDETSPYSDREKITAEKYLQDPDQFGEEVFVGDFLPIDGALEPLTIRDSAAFSSIEDPVSRKVRGAIMCGNEDSYNGSDIKGSYISYSANSDFVPFEDSAGTSANTLIQTPGFIGDALADKVSPFDDSELDTRFLVTNDDINAELLVMTGSADDDFRPNNSKASTSGFVYSNKEGTDSLAFGGLLRG